MNDKTLRRLAMAGSVPGHRMRLFPVRLVALAVLLSTCMMFGALAPAHAAGASLESATLPPAGAEGPAVAADTPAFRQAAARERDAETLNSLTTEGRLLLSRDRVKLPAYDYCSMAVAAAERGDFRDSVDAAARALVLAERTDNADLAALSKRDLAIAYNYAGALDDAERYAKDALASHPKSPEQVFAPAHKVLGDVALRRKQPQVAIDEYNAALTTASPRYAPLVRISLVNAYLAAVDPVAARSAFKTAGAAPTSDLNALYRRVEGDLLLAEGKPQEARQAFEAVLDKASSSDVNYDRLWAHEGIGRTWLAVNDKPQARAAYLLAVDDSEKIRARFHSEEFKTGLFGDTQIVFEQAILLSADAGDFAGAWRLSERSRSRALLDVVRNNVDAGVNDAQLNGVLPSLDDVQRGLRPNEAIVEFHELKDSLIAWVIRSDGMTGRTLPVAQADIDKDVADFRNAIVRRRQSALAYGDKLETVLIAPLGLRDGERLLIVPHGALHYLPFQALHGPGGYLLEQHAIALEPSASVAMQLSQRPQQVSSSLVAFGNPRIAPAYELPDAEREVRDIAPLFTRQATFVQSQATRVSFRDNAPGGRVLHVATHAQADSVDPLHSSILLAPADQPADGPDSLLAKDIYNLKLSGVSLVTLSACETGLGRIARGDEILGFTQAFFYAGATSLIVSMWPVADQSSALTMRTLYTQMTENHQAIDALRAAQLAVLRTKGFSHPFFWAPFDLMGGWRLTVAG